jgi:FkbM family methyltransferase
MKLKVPLVKLKYKLLEYKSIMQRKAREIFLHSYSQYGEDIVLGHLLCKNLVNQIGFYIDIGAHAPRELNNTYKFYRQGWEGVNIEPNPFSAKHFARSRPRDLTLSLAIGSENKSSIFYRFNPSTLSTLDKYEASKYQREGFKLLSKANVKTLTLKSLFEKYAAAKDIDFISLDIEGYELEALKSNDWNIYRPWLLLIETNRNDSEIVKYLKSVNYLAIWSNKTNTIFVDCLSNRVEKQLLAGAL